MKRLLLCAAAAAASGVVGVSPARATNECKGLQICVRVHGPWVVVSPTRAPAQFQLSCPRGFIVGGLDAQLSDRAIDVDFLGLVGSPVGPGVTTSASAVFRGVFTGASRRTPTFRPHIGCLPTAGGGSGPVPYRRPDAFPPGKPTVRRVRTVRLRVGVTRAVTACVGGERLISSWHSIGFEGETAPSAAVVASASATSRVVGPRVLVQARLRAPVRAVVQVGAVCGGGA